MTSYHGGKYFIGKQIAQAIHKDSEQEKFKGYCEPFCGMLGVYRHIPDLFVNKKMRYKAGDLNRSVIKMWRASQNGWKPPTRTTEAQYNLLKNSKDSALRGYIGFQYSFSGKFFNGYTPKYGKSVETVTQSKRVATIGRKLSKVSFKNKPYNYYSRLKGYIIYCDPPYGNTDCEYFSRGTEALRRKLKFDNKKFWDWVRDMSVHNLVYVSEYSAPPDFECIWTRTIKKSGILKNDRTEKLFRLPK